MTTNLGDTTNISRKNKRMVSVLCLMIIVVLGGVLVYFYLARLKPPIAPAPTVPPKVTKPVLPSAEAKVTIGKEGFTPSTVLVKKGSQVTWINTDEEPHQVVSDPHPTHSNLPSLEMDEPLLTNESFTFTFEKVGTFAYHDELNPLDLKGTIIVE